MTFKIEKFCANPIFDFGFCVHFSANLLSFCKVDILNLCFSNMSKSVELVKQFHFHSPVRLKSIKRHTRVNATQSTEVASEAHSPSSLFLCHCGEAAKVRVSCQPILFGRKLYSCRTLLNLPNGKIWSL
ncbi:hypothetical protein DM860_006902 [Cuscuta australis]|uniref:Uncharacterized protein n=1 Tax=Cuscuta australis TaxID=267555 RepID=A0A328E6P4_9ASTE|nr:hypothetical protein DM860_006902 [Cuscuta australis]